jgi:hypothetical protein
MEAKEKGAGDPPADISLRNGEANPDADSDDYSREKPTRPDKRNRGSGSKGQRQDRHKEKAKRRASGREIDDEVCIISLGQVILVVHEIHRCFLPTQSNFVSILRHL